jgi:hypothetical protein
MSRRPGIPTCSEVTDHHRHRTRVRVGPAGSGSPLSKRLRAGQRSFLLLVGGLSALGLCTLTRIADGLTHLLVRHHPEPTWRQPPGRQPRPAERASDRDRAGWCRRTCCPLSAGRLGVPDAAAARPGPVPAPAPTDTSIGGKSPQSRNPACRSGSTSPITTEPKAQSEAFR